MDPIKIYVIAWTTVCAAGGYLVLAKRDELAKAYRGYFRFLTRPWRIATFLFAWISLAAVGRYANDPTWDDITSTFMSFLTFATAPWAVGVLYRAIFGIERRALFVFLAAVAWQVSASWSYDGYLLIRDGAYPLTWWSNMLASGLLYLGAGLMWNLTTTEKSVTFAFTRTRWLHETNQKLSWLIWFVLPFALFFAKLMADLL